MIAIACALVALGLLALGVLFLYWREIEDGLHSTICAVLGFASIACGCVFIVEALSRL